MQSGENVQGSPFFLRENGAYKTQKLLVINTRVKSPRLEVIVDAETPSKYENVKNHRRIIKANNFLAQVT